MLPLSLIIITKNEIKHIAACIEAVKPICADIVVADSGSSDGTVEAAKACGARVYPVEWTGYSDTKNRANQWAENDWILSLDADEIATPALLESIKSFMSSNPSSHTVALIRRRLVYRSRLLYYGSTRHEYRKRLFNRTHAQWNSQAVHEDLNSSSDTYFVKLKGIVEHDSYRDKNDLYEKLERYAQLFAKQKAEEGKRASWLKLYVSPYVLFLKNLIIRLGLLDGMPGIEYAMAELYYSKRKYRLIKRYYESGAE